MQADPIILQMVYLALLVIGVSIVTRLLKQPMIVGYIISGIIAGPFVLRLITQEASIARLGEVGIILLLFFIGMEINLQKLLKQWKISLFGTMFQILITGLAVLVIGSIYGWGIPEIIFFAFILSLSSTAIILRLLEERNELNKPIGQKILSILLAQDVIVIPMIIVVGLLSGGHVSSGELMMQGIGALMLAGILVYLIKAKEVHLPFKKQLKADHETQVFAAIILCFGLATITGLLGLSAALGAFVAGIILSSAKETHWVHNSLHSFRTLFVALFFVSIGMLIDLNFFVENWEIVMLLVGVAFILNTAINSLILRFLGTSWKESFHGGSVLSQIGEFSFLLAATGFAGGLISIYGYQLAIIIISITLLLTPEWVKLIHFLSQKIK